MPNYRRYFVEGGAYFFTVKTDANAPIFASDAAANLLGRVMREARDRWPFDSVASVLLPDHLHVIWSLPRGDAAYSKRLGWIKKEFTRRYLESGGEEQFVTASRRSNRRRGVWQRRFWEHSIDGEDELQAYMDYVRYNPVKHGYVKAPREWRHSSFHRWVERGVYTEDWGRSSQPSNVVAIDVGE